MFCFNCGAQISDSARFCPSCGESLGKPDSSVKRTDSATKMSGSPIGSVNTPTKMSISLTELQNVATKAQDALGGIKTDALVASGKLPLIEGIAYGVMALVILFAPTVSLNYVVGSATSTMLGTVVRLSQFSEYLGGYGGLLLFIGFFTLCAVVAAITNAKKSFSNDICESRVIFGHIKLSNSPAGCVTGYAIITLMLLGLVSSRTHGVVGATGWVWFLLLGGIACQVLDYVRLSGMTPGKVASR